MTDRYTYMVTLRDHNGRLIGRTEWKPTAEQVARAKGLDWPEDGALLRHLQRMFGDEAVK